MATAARPVGPQGEAPRSGLGADGRWRRGRAAYLAPEPRSRGRVQRARLELLTTLASSLSVALENARLFDETQRLLTETNERAAELALINDVQNGLAEKLDMQSMYDLVGDRIQAIFDAQIVDIGVIDRERSSSGSCTRSSAASGSPTRRCRSSARAGT